MDLTLEELRRHPGTDEAGMRMLTIRTWLAQAAARPSTLLSSVVTLNLNHDFVNLMRAVPVPARHVSASGKENGKLAGRQFQLQVIFRNGKELCVSFIRIRLDDYFQLIDGCESDDFLSRDDVVYINVFSMNLKLT